MFELPAKESLTVEFKSDIKCLSDNDIIDAIVGLANTEGGYLYLGIEDNGSVTGLHNNHKDVIKTGVMVANKTVPSLAVRIDIVNQDNLPVMVFEIPKSQSIVATSATNDLSFDLVITFDNMDNNIGSDVWQNAKNRRRIFVGDWTIAFAMLTPV